MGDQVNTFAAFFQFMFNYRWREHYKRNMTIELNTKQSLQSEEGIDGLVRQSGDCYQRNKDKISQLYETLENVSPKLYARI